VPTLLTLLTIRAQEIDYERARGANGGDAAAPPARVLALLKDRPLVIFLICAVLFHFANAAMLPLLGEMLARGKGRSSMLFMSACVVTTQLVITVLAVWSGKKAGSWGTKPMLLIAFAALPLRAVQCTVTNDTVGLVAIQILDGAAAGIFGVVSVLVIADPTRGSGRFHLTLGAVSTAVGIVGIGACLSQVIAGSIVHRFGYDVGWVFLGAVAVAALAVLCRFMPETRDPALLAPSTFSTFST
jgi:MFS family permease